MKTGLARGTPARARANSLGSPRGSLTFDLTHGKTMHCVVITGATGVIGSELVPRSV